MDDATLYDRMLASMDVTYVWGRGEQVRLPGVAAFVCPLIPHRSVFNGVVYRDTDALIEALPQLDRTYEEAGVQAWTVWTPEGDGRAREALEAFGHVLDATPEAMAAPLEEIDARDGADGLDWSQAHGPEGVEEMCSILEDAFAWEADLAVQVLDGLEREAHIYLARVDGVASAVVGCWDVDGDAGIYWVGTRSEARGRGLCTGLMRQAALDARDRGAQTTSLQATAMGRPLYERLGYRGLGAIEMWEKRRT